MPPPIEETPSLGDALYSALRLSPGRIRFMAIATVLVCVLPVVQALGSETPTRAEAVVDLAAFATADEATFEVQSLTDAFTRTVTSRTNLEEVADQASVDVDSLRTGLTVDGEDGATQVAVSYADVDADLASEIAVIAARGALRELAAVASSSAERDVLGATDRLSAAEAALDAFEAEVGATDVPGLYDRLSSQITELTLSQAAGSDPQATDAALAAAVAERDRLQPHVRQAESLEAERQGAVDQLLAANQEVSRAQTLATAADSGDVVRPGFTSREGRAGKLLTAAATGGFVGVVASYLLTWVIFRRRTR